MSSTLLSQHLPALQIVLPLISAPLCSLLGGGKRAWGFATLVAWSALAIAVGLLGQVLASGPFTYEIGGWAAPWGIEYKLDYLNALILLIVTGIGAAVLSFARMSVDREIPADKQGLFYTAFLLCLTGLLGITITGDAFNVFVFLEISALSSYALIAMGAGTDRRALTAAYNYLILGTIGATFYLIGVGLIYMMTGTLNIADMAARLVDIQDKSTILAAAGFLTIGIALKAAMFPLHMWLPNGYTYAPNAVTAFLAGTATKVSIYVLLRFFFTIFGADFSFGDLPLADILMGLAVVGFLAASTVAIFQTNIKRMLAYSSVAQIGYMLLGIAFVSVSGLTAGIAHMFNHAIIKTGLFLALGCVFYRIGSVHLNDMAGLGKRMPLTMFAFVLGGLGLIGVPLTAGFVSKWYLILAALELGSTLGYVLTGLILFSSLLAVIYIWRVVEVAYFREPPEGAAAVREAPLSLLVPTWILTLASFYFGIDTSLNIGVAAKAAAFLLRVQ